MQRNGEKSQKENGKEEKEISIFNEGGLPVRLFFYKDKSILIPVTGRLMMVVSASTGRMGQDFQKFNKEMQVFSG